MTAQHISAAVGDRLIASPAARRVVRHLFRFRGGRVLGHAVRRRAYRPTQVVIDDFDGDLRFGCRLDEHMGSQIYWRGSYSWPHLQVLGRLLRDGMTFVDVGANQGEFSLFAAKRLPHGRVVSFEPADDLRSRLEANVGRNGFTNVEIHADALWSEPTVLTFHRHRGTYVDGSVNEGLGSLFESPPIPGPRGGAPLTDGEDVRCTTIDRVVADLDIGRVDVVKVDVEGAETHVLAGATDTLARDRPILLLEADEDQAERAGSSVASLLGDLEERYRFETIERNGRTLPLDRRRLRRHEDLLCLPH